MIDCFDVFIKIFFNVVCREIYLGNSIYITIWECILGGFLIGIFAMFIFRILGIKVNMENKKINAGIRGYWKGKDK